MSTPNAETQLELAAILENSPLGILFSRNRMVRQANALCARIFGYALDEFVGLQAVSLYPDQGAYERMGDQARPTLTAGQPYQAETQLRRKDGSLIWCRMTAKAVNPARTQDGTLWIVEDVTASREIEERAQRAYDEQQVIFDNAAVGILFSRDHVVQRCNRRLAEIYGYEVADMLGRSTRMFYASEDDYQHVAREANPVIRAGGVYRGEIRARRLDGQPFWARITVRRRDSASGSGGERQSEESVWIFEDVTDQHRAEDELLRAREELEQRVVERTAELTTVNSQLQGEVLERMQSEQRVWHMAHHDGLTGLPNRTLLHDRLAQTLVQAQRNQQHVAVMFLDLDRFKNINDTLGHDVGDELLKHVAQRLLDAVRAVDTVSRIGGDEFVIVLSEISSADDVVQVAEKILHALFNPVMIAHHALMATPSIGISLFPDDGSEAFDLMKHADTAMYHAKSGGRNTFRFFDAQMNEETKKHAALESKLRQAIDGGQLRLHYQTVVSGSVSGPTLTVCGMEALVRWEDPVQGLVMPAEFLPVAESAGLILALGDWVLKEALRQNRHWQQEGRPLLPISVNLSRSQFLQPGLVEKIGRLLAESGQPANLLELEIPEGSLQSEGDEALVRLRALSAMGVRLAIDGFGTGYSSLVYLKRFPVSRLKIDRKFVRDLATSEEAAAVVNASVGLARTMGLEPLAEAVESVAQWTLLRQMGCDKFQGHLFAPPAPPDQADAIFAPPALSALAAMQVT
jgi:diguanylate cyclase (GGDEF)-like protein/PAS domain S-box-containing protein